MQTITLENRTVLKTFRTTSTLAENLKKLAKKKVSESDIINTALEEYFVSIKATGVTKEDFGEKNLMNYEYHRKKAIAILNNINKKELIIINSPKQAANFIQKFMPLDIENIFAIYLSPRNHILKVQIAAEGTQKYVVTNLSLILKTAIELDPCQVILVHNHPGGIAAPSPADIFSARETYFGFAYNNIKYADEIIIAGKSKYYSFVDHGYFKKFKKDLSESTAVAKKKWYIK